MLVSEARREANRRNAARSTGPKTAEGKDASRRNALKHGLTATTVDIDDAVADARAGEERAATPASSVEPTWSWQGWVCGELAGITRRLDRLHREEAKLQTLVAYRALTSWDEDRRLDAETLGERLAAHPSRVARQLRSTPAGCDWLIDRWLVLAHVADEAARTGSPAWTPVQRQLAFDLLGTPADVRPDHPGIVLDAQGHATGVPRAEEEVARAALADLRACRDEVADADEATRAMVEGGMSFDASTDLRRLRRYEAELNRRLRWCVALLQQDDAGAEPPLPPGPRDKPEPAEPVTPPPARPLAADPVQPAPSATSRHAGVTGSPLAERPRVAARLHQAESRRDKKSRKLDRRRA